MGLGSRRPSSADGGSNSAPLTPELDELTLLNVSNVLAIVFNWMAEI